MIHYSGQAQQEKEKDKYKQKTKTPAKSCLKQSAKGQRYEEDGLPHERSSENVTSPASCSQRKVIVWQTKNESSGDEDSDSLSNEKNLTVFDWIINKKNLE